MYKKGLFSFLILLLGIIHFSPAQVKNDKYVALQEKLASGWNTWSYESMLNHVLLPHGLSIKVNLRQSFIGTPGDPLFLLDRITPDTTGLVKPIAHTFDGSYTALLINDWKGNTLQIQSTTDGQDVYILITPKKLSSTKFQIEVQSGMMWNREGMLTKNENGIQAVLPNQTIQVRSTKEFKEKSSYPYLSPYLVFDGDEEMAIYTGQQKSLDEIKILITKAKNAYHNHSKKYGELASAFEGIQTVLGWNTLYDASKNRVLSPVTRAWNETWQGHVLFEWDTYLAALLFALDNKELAYSNAIAVTKWPNANGNIGHYQMGDGTVSLMSQPPVGSMVCWKIYEKYGDKWFLEEVYQELLTWNRWWTKNRKNGDYLTWGGWKGANAQIAAWESGLDNSPMYDDLEMTETENAALLDLADVGLNSLYVMDCQYLSKIAKELGYDKDHAELQKRAKHFTKLTQQLWNANESIYQNKVLSTNTFSSRLSPTLFYPMIANVSTDKQAEVMIKDHYYNEVEFYGDFIIPSTARNDPSYDNVYWRGAIWPPMNFLVYLGLKNYDQEAASDLVEKSYALFLKEWTEHNAVLENINADKGVESIGDQKMADPFYHWGALMGIMKFMEQGWYAPSK